ncbi:MAG: hypothetical protein ACE362_02975 [Phaeodactylibacter xiamenensis]|nr:hypothetical protein [Phaeodactylibacter xiamenensis]MCR9051193.1 hypothetical protein [bacterium]
MRWYTIITTATIILSLLSGAVSAQQPIRQRVSEASSFIQQAENRGERLLHMQCDILPKGGEDPRLSLFNLRADQSYRVWVSITRDIQELTVHVVRIGDNETVRTKTVRNGGEGSILINGLSGDYAIGLEPLEYSAQVMSGFFSLVVTHRPNQDRQSDNQTTSETDNPQNASTSANNQLSPVSGNTSPVSTDCAFSNIEGMKFKTSTATTVRSDNRKSQRRVKSKVEFDSRLRKIEQKIKGGNNVVYSIRSKGCEPGGVFRFEAEDGRMNAVTVFLNLNTRTFTILPKGSQNRINYNIENEKYQN